jgi:hypothetical protein
MNNKPEDEELEEIATQWNKQDSMFLLDLDVSIDLTFNQLSFIFLVHFRIGFFVGELLIKKLNNNDGKYDELLLSFICNSLV